MVHHHRRRSSRRRSRRSRRQFFRAVVSWVGTARRATRFSPRPQSRAAASSPIISLPQPQRAPGTQPQGAPQTARDVLVAFDDQTQPATVVQQIALAAGLNPTAYTEDAPASLPVLYVKALSTPRLDGRLKLDRVAHLKKQGHAVFLILLRMGAGSVQRVQDPKSVSPDVDDVFEFVHLNSVLQAIPENTQSAQDLRHAARTM